MKDEAPLLFASRLGEPIAVRTLLRQPECDVAVFNASGNTALHLACMSECGTSGARLRPWA